MITTTPQIILDAAYPRSLKNKPGVIASESTELLQTVIRAMRGLYALAARVNPTYFADSADVVASDSIITAGALAIDAVAEKFQLATSAYIVGGVSVAKNAQTGIVFSAAHVITANTYGAVLVMINAAGTVSTKVVATPQAYTSAAAAIAALPDADATKLAIGYVLINNNAGDWTANTDDLTNGSDVTTATFITFQATGARWARPQAAESILKIEGLGTATTPTTAGEIVVVPWDDREAESGKAALYEFGQVFHGAGNASDPTGGQVRFLFSKRPDDPATLTSTIDAQWNEDYNELLILEVAMYLALKDISSGRESELAALRENRDAWARLFIAHLEHATANTRARMGHIRRITTQTLVPINSILAGGSNLATAA